MTYPSQNNGLYKKLIIISYVFSVAVFILVGLMRQVKINLGFDFLFFLHIMLCSIPWYPFFNIGFYLYKKGDYIMHKRMIFGALVFSALFYFVMFCTTLQHRKQRIAASIQLYFFLLISHIILAGLSLPFILITFSRGITYHIALHKKWQGGFSLSGYMLR